MHVCVCVCVCVLGGGYKAGCMHVCVLGGGGGEITRLI